MAVTSKTHKGVRDWSVKARRDGDAIVVTVKCGVPFVKVVLSAVNWPRNLYDQCQAATRALADAIGVPWADWDSGELDRIPDEIVKAVNEVMT